MSATVVRVESASQEDRMLTEWAAEAYKSSLKLANEMLVQMISIASLLLAAALGFLDKSGVGRAWQIPVFVSLLAVVIVAMLGLIPSWSEVDIREPKPLHDLRTESLRKKRLALGVNTVLLVAAFVFAILGVLTSPR